MKHCPRCGEWIEGDQIRDIEDLVTKGYYCHHITLSLHPIQGGYPKLIHLLWQAQANTLRVLMEEKVILGGVRRYEIAPTSFSDEGMFIPHTHACVISLVGTLDFKMIEAEFLRQVELLRQPNRKCLTKAEKKTASECPAAAGLTPEEDEICTNVLPDVDVESIDRDGVEGVYTYMRKPVSVVEVGGVYGRVAGLIESSRKSQAEQERAFHELNRAAAEALEFMTLVQTKPQFFSTIFQAFGILNSQVGVKKPRKGKRKRTGA